MRYEIRWSYCKSESETACAFDLESGGFSLENLDDALNLTRALEAWHYWFAKSMSDRSRLQFFMLEYAATGEQTKFHWRLGKKMEPHPPTQEQLGLLDFIIRTVGTVDPHKITYISAPPIKQKFVPALTFEWLELDPISLSDIYQVWAFSRCKQTRTGYRSGEGGETWLYGKVDGKYFAARNHGYEWRELTKDEWNDWLADSTEEKEKK